MLHSKVVSFGHFGQNQFDGSGSTFGHFSVKIKIRIDGGLGDGQLLEEVLVFYTERSGIF